MNKLIVLFLLYFRFKLSTRQSLSSAFQGQINGVNIYSDVLKVSNIHLCNSSNQGNVISWVMFDQCRNKGYEVIYPSSCLSNACLPGYEGEFCDVPVGESLQSLYLLKM